MRVLLFQRLSALATVGPSSSVTAGDALTRITLHADFEMSYIRSPTSVIDRDSALEVQGMRLTLANSLYILARYSEHVLRVWNEPDCKKMCVSNYKCHCWFSLTGMYSRRLRGGVGRQTF